MNQFEHDLRESLRHRDPPPDFADKVLAKARESRAGGRSSRTWLAAAALVVLMVGGGLFVQEQRRRAEGERAKEQLMVGLRITSSKLRDVQERIFLIQQRAVQPRSEQ